MTAPGSPGPACAPPILAAIPAFLTDQPRWLGWKLEVRTDKPDEKPTKVPKSWKNFNAKSTDKKTWAPFNAIADYFEKQQLWDGVGITFGDLGNGEFLIGFDLDTCIVDGNAAPWALPLIAALRTYIEVSPSETGLKAFLRCRTADIEPLHKALGLQKGSWGCRRGVGGNGKDHGAAIEVYLSARIFTVTGVHWPDTPEDVEFLDLDALLHVAELVRSATGGSNNGTSNGNGKDDSRSATAFRLGARLVREGADYEHMCDGIRNHPSTAEYRDKGEANDQRELKRIWDKVNNALILWPHAPLENARELIRRHYFAGELPTLQHQQSTFYRWTGSRYAEFPHEDVRAAAYAFLDSAKVENKEGELTPYKPNQKSVSWLLDALSAASQLPPDTKAPAWLDTAKHAPPTEVLAFTNGLLHLPTRRLRPHTPSFFNLHAVDYPYEPNAPEPKQWIEFLTTIWLDDKQSIYTLQEIFGIALTTDTSHHKTFLIVGPPRSGKGTIARILTAMLGKENVAGPTLSSLGDRFGAAPLIGKPLAIISDARLSGRTDAAIVAERLLSISGEDAIDVDRKNRDVWHGTLPTRFLILTNLLPALADASGAIVSRFIVLRLVLSFIGRENTALTNQLLTELPGILNWALAGYNSLRKRGHFTQPASAAEAVRALQDLGSPISAFVRDRCEVKPGPSIEVNTLFNAWVEWCRDENRDRPGTKENFAKELRSVLPGLKTIQSRSNQDGKTTRERHYEGIKLQD